MVLCDSTMNYLPTCLLPLFLNAAGALAGALHGDAWLPARWTQALENGPRGGRDSVAALARDLAALRWGGEDPASRN